jgi:hypothetical protein
MPGGRVWRRDTRHAKSKQANVIFAVPEFYAVRSGDTVNEKPSLAFAPLLTKYEQIKSEKVSKEAANGGGLQASITIKFLLVVPDRPA